MQLFRTSFEAFKEADWVRKQYGYPYDRVEVLQWRHGAVVEPIGGVRIDDVE